MKIKRRGVTHIKGRSSFLQKYIIEAYQPPQRYQDLVTNYRAKP